MKIKRNVAKEEKFSEVRLGTVRAEYAGCTILFLKFVQFATC